MKSKRRDGCSKQEGAGWPNPHKAGGHVLFVYSTLSQVYCTHSPLPYSYVLTVSERQQALKALAPTPRRLAHTLGSKPCSRCFDTCFDTHTHSQATNIKHQTSNSRPSTIKHHQHQHLPNRQHSSLSTLPRHLRVTSNVGVPKGADSTSTRHTYTYTYTRNPPLAGASLIHSLTHGSFPNMPLTTPGARLMVRMVAPARKGRTLT